jgi:hypothetical protein
MYNGLTRALYRQPRWSLTLMLQKSSLGKGKTLPKGDPPQGAGAVLRCHLFRGLEQGP